MMSCNSITPLICSFSETTSGVPPLSDIVRTIEHALEEATFVARPTLDDYAASDAEARRIAREFLKI